MSKRLAVSTIHEKYATPLTFMEELHVQFEARLLANDGKLFPLSQSLPPSPEQIKRVRQQFEKRR